MNKVNRSTHIHFNTSLACLNRLYDEFRKYPNDYHVIGSLLECDFGVCSHSKAHEGHSKLTWEEFMTEMPPEFADRIIHLNGAHYMPDAIGKLKPWPVSSGPQWSESINYGTMISSVYTGWILKNTPNFKFEVTSKQHMYTALCGRTKKHRIHALNALVNLGLQHNGIMTFGAVNEYIDNINTNRQLNESTTQKRTSVDGLQVNFWPYIKWDNLAVKETATQRMSFITPPPWYSNVLFDIVLESNPHCVFITEKTVKPLLYGLPFVVCGGKYHNRCLKELGFELYEEYFDIQQESKISYVETNNEGIPEQKFNFDSYEKMLKPLTDIPTRNSKSYSSIYRQCLPKILHNQNQVIKLAFNDDLMPDIVKENPEQFKRNLDMLHESRKIIRSHEYFRRFCP